MSRPSTPDQGLSLGRIFGVPVVLAPSWLIIAVLITVAYAPVVQDRVDVGSGAYAVSFAFAVLLAASVLAHELGHCVVALRFGLPVRRLTIVLLGGATEIDRQPETPGREAAVAVIGPVISIALGGLSYAALRLLPVGGILELLLQGLAATNLLVGVFNLLPGLPLDGGRVLRAAVWRLRGDELAGTVAAAWGGRVVAVGVVAFAGWRASTGAGLLGSGNVLLALAVAGFLWVGASQQLAQVKVRRRLPALDAARLARRAVLLPTTTPVAVAVERAHAERARAIVAIDSAGRPVGVVVEDAVQALPEHRRPWVDIAALARPVRPEHLLDDRLSGGELLTALQTNPVPEHVLVNREGNVTGVLATADVAVLLDPRRPAPARAR